MKFVTEEMDRLETSLDDILSECGISREDVEACQRILMAIKELSGNIAGIRDDEFDRIILEAVAG